ncbi:MAG TPA: ArsA family ATPase [Vicinamibacterales bacterium]
MKARAGSPQLVFFAGKGGVGKTTCAAARAVAEASRGRRTLAVSTDPAHSLGDALQRRLSWRPTHVAPNLDAMEVDACRAFERWMRRHYDALHTILDHGTWLADTEIRSLLALPVPGVDELVGLIEIIETAGRRYDAVIVDTAPTGHTLHLLTAPRTVEAVAGVLDDLQQHHRVLRAQFAGRSGLEAEDVFIDAIAGAAQRVASALRDREHASFEWVTLPEELSVAESEDGIRALADRGIGVGRIIVNEWLGDAGSCARCRQRRAAQRRVLTTIRRTIGRGRHVQVVPWLENEPRGLRALATLGTSARDSSPKRNAAAQRATTRVREHETHGGDAALLDNVRDARLIFVGGKGGVGKTTVAATLAIGLARKQPSRSFLLLSADPAHSLGDVLRSSFGDRGGLVPSGPRNLIAREVDATRAMAERRDALREAIDELENEFGSVGSESGGSAGGSSLLELAPPGIDELFGLLAIVDALDARDVVIVDTAPTGHALRLLQTPAVVREWLQLLLKVLLEHRSVVRPGRLAAELVGTSRRIRQLEAIHRDRARTQFLVVTRAAAMPILETRRLLRELRTLHLAPSSIVVNARTLSPGECRRCRSVAASERRALTTLVRPRDCDIIEAPLVAIPPRGAPALTRWARTWSREGRPKRRKA